MKLYSEYPHASIVMHDDPVLRQLLRDLICREQFTHVLESGTYLGLGSTRFVAESFPPAFPPEIFLTIEVSWKNWRRARVNLQPFPFVRPVWGLTVTRKAAVDFIRNDGFLKNHRQIENVFIDDIQDPVAFYLKELSGRLRQTGSQLGLKEKLGKLFLWSGEDLLRRFLRKFSGHSPLIILDSAGGIGFLEFSILLEAMSREKYTVLLDDVHHIKHYRSAEHIRNDASFRVLGSSDTHGWLLAQHG